MIIEYSIDGTAADGQTWTTKGRISAEYPQVFSDAMAQSFQQLTQGKAVFGKPGVGCKGPYKINRFELVTVER
jgi:hypothetical protein